MIAASLGLMVVAVIHGIASKTMWVVKEIESSAEVLEGAQYLSGLLSREIGLAGFYGDFQPTSFVGSARPNFCQHMDREQVIKAMPFPVDGIDNVGSDYRLCGGETLLSGTDVILVRRSVISQKSPRHKLQSQQIYIQGAFNNSNPIIDRGDNSVAFNLMQGTERKPVRAWQQTIYYVSKDNTFKRRRFLNGKYRRSEPLVDGVHDFQVEYMLRSADKSSPCSEDYLSPPLTNQQWEQVIAVRLHFLLRSSWQGISQKSQEHKYANKTYVIPDDGHYELFKVLAPVMNKL